MFTEVIVKINQGVRFLEHPVYGVNQLLDASLSIHIIEHKRVLVHTCRQSHLSVGLLVGWSVRSVYSYSVLWQNG